MPSSIGDLAILSRRCSFLDTESATVREDAMLNCHKIFGIPALVGWATTPFFVIKNVEEKSRSSRPQAAEASSHSAKLQGKSIILRAGIIAIADA